MITIYPLQRDYCPSIAPHKNTQLPPPPPKHLSAQGMQMAGAPCFTMLENHGSMAAAMPEKHSAMSIAHCSLSTTLKK